MADTTSKDSTKSKDAAQTPAEAQAAAVEALQPVETEGSVITAAADRDAAAPGVLVRKSRYGTGPGTVDDSTNATGLASTAVHWRGTSVEDVARAYPGITEAGLDFLRRAYGELYQHEAGGPPASDAALDVAKRLDGKGKDITDWVNEQGVTLQKTEGEQLHNKGWSLGAAASMPSSRHGQGVAS